MIYIKVKSIALIDPETECVQDDFPANSKQKNLRVFINFVITKATQVPPNAIS